jgi:hypothetical protein
LVAGFILAVILIVIWLPRPDLVNYAKVNLAPARSNLPGRAYEKAIGRRAVENRGDLDAYVEAEIRKLTPGRILFNPPEDMTVGVEEAVEARITKTIAGDLSKGLKGRGLPRIEEIKVGTFMRASLEGENFRVTPTNGDKDQPVLNEGFTQWSWRVLPLKSGNQLLLLMVTVRLKIPNEQEEYKNYPVFEKGIKVKVNPVYTFTEFIKNEWKWIITVLILPLISWIAKRWLTDKDKRS